jgi:lambda repressor-like predicted transcriptional regulator
LYTLYAKKTLAGAMALSLVISGCLLAGNGRAAAAGSISLTAQGHSVERYASLTDLQNRWRKQSEEIRRAGPPILEEAAQILGVDKDALKVQLKSGKSIADIASEKGLSEAALTEKLMASRITKLEEGIQAGKLTRERADVIKAKMQSHISFKLKQKGLEDEEHGHHAKKHAGLLPHLGPDKLSSMLGISKEQLISELKAGKSLADIAQEKGISKEQLIAKIKDELTPALEKAIERKAPLDKKQAAQKK